MLNKIIFFLIFSIQLVLATPKINMYHEKTPNGFNIYCDNLNPCLISIKIDFTLKNLKPNNETSIHTIRANENRYLITKLTPKNKHALYHFKYNYTTNYGDHFQKKYDVNYEYNLPFEKGESFCVSQGYNGSFSHTNENSLDFNLPENTPILSIRDGIVIEVVTSNTISCPTKKCKEYANYITIHHPDGTFANYVHLKHKGAIVQKGTKIQKGQIIGYSGNTGWSNGSHLHLTVYLQKLQKRETLKTLFRTNNGISSNFLDEGSCYNRNY